MGSRPTGPSPSNGQHTASLAPDVAKYFESSTKAKLLIFAPYPDIAESILSFNRQKCSWFSCIDVTRYLPSGLKITLL